jgi:predicted RNase H-like HicB family nuclease
MQIVEKYQCSLPSESYTWVVRKQLNCFGRDEFLIEIKELEGCVSYGDTLAEAKEGLCESIELWLKHHRINVSLAGNSKAQLIYMVPQMTREEFERINYQLLHIVLN